MPTLVRKLWMGQPHYSVLPDPDGGNQRKLRQGETGVRVTPEQAARGVEFCSLLLEAGKLK